MLIRQAKWIHVCPVNKLTNNVRICERHFVKGRPADLEEVDDVDWVPSRFMRSFPSKPNKVDSAVVLIDEQLENRRTISCSLTPYDKAPTATTSVQGDTVIKSSTVYQNDAMSATTTVISGEEFCTVTEPESEDPSNLISEIFNCSMEQVPVMQNLWEETENPDLLVVPADEEEMSDTLAELAQFQDSSIDRRWVTDHNPEMLIQDPDDFECMIEDSRLIETSEYSMIPTYGLNSSLASVTDDRVHYSLEEAG